MAWTGQTVETFFARYETTSAITMTGATPTNSDVLGSSTHKLGGVPILVGINIVSAGLDVVATLKLQYSFDNTNWFDHSTPIADTTPNVTGYKVASVDLTSWEAPYWRLRFNDGGLAVGTSGTFKFLLVGYNALSNVVAHSYTGT